MYAREAFVRDRENWKSVILLNVVRCMQRVVECVQTAENADEEDSADELPPDAPPPLSSLFNDSHRRICLRLRASLDLAERGLKARISPHTTTGAYLPRSRPSTSEGLVDREAEAELTVHAQSYAISPRFEDPRVGKPSRRLSVLPPDTPVDLSDPKDPTHLTWMCRQDMIELWNDPAVKEILAIRRVRWQEWPGLYVISPDPTIVLSYILQSFLNDLERVTAKVSCLSSTLKGNTI